MSGKLLKKSKILALFSSIFLLVFLLAGCGNDSENQASSGTDQSWLARGEGADKIEVVHFHGTIQCWSCEVVGKYALKTIKEKFPDEYKNGTIVFKDINGELPVNQEIVAKYQARGSSLFINAIKDGRDNIQEEVNVWRYISDEAAFISYFENKLKNLLK